MRRSQGIWRKQRRQQVEREEIRTVISKPFRCSSFCSVRFSSSSSFFCCSPLSLVPPSPSLRLSPFSSSRCASFSSSSSSPPPSSLFLGQVQVMQVRVVDLPSALSESAAAEAQLSLLQGGARNSSTLGIPLLEAEDENEAGRIGEHTQSQKQPMKQSRPTTSASPSPLPLSISSFSSVSLSLPSPSSAPDSRLPLLTHVTLTQPKERQKLWAAINQHKFQQQLHEQRVREGSPAGAAGERLTSPHSSAAPSSGMKFLIEKSLLPELFLAQPAIANAQIGSSEQKQQLLDTAGDAPAAFSSSDSSSASVSAASLLPSLATSSSLHSSLTTQLSHVSAAPLHRLVERDSFLLKQQSQTHGVGPKLVYPVPSAAEAALLRAASRSDLTAFRQLLETHQIVASNQAKPVTVHRKGGEENRRMNLLNLNVHDEKNGATPLHLIAANGNMELLSLLLSPPYLPYVDLNSRSSNAATPLHWAAGSGHVSTVELLLDRGVDCTARSLTWNHNVFGRGSGQTAAHWAAESGHLDIVKKLHEREPMTAVMEDERSHTPKMVAEKAAQTSVAEFLDEVAKKEYVCVELSLAWSGERVIQK